MDASPLDLAAEGLYRELNQNNYKLETIPEVTRPIALLYMFQGMVDNGGFRYPMENDLPGQPSYSLISDAYRAIGSADAGEALDKAVALFSFPNPELNAEARNEYFDSLGEYEEFDASDFGKLSDKVCGNRKVWTNMDEYVAMHIEDFAPFTAR